MMVKHNRKGQAVNLSNFGMIVLLFAIAVIVTVVSASVLTDVHNQYNTLSDNRSAAFNVSQKGEGGMVNMAGQYSNVGTVIGAAVIIAILLGAFAFYKMGGGVQMR